MDGVGNGVTVPGCCVDSVLPWAWWCWPALLSLEPGQQGQDGEDVVRLAKSNDSKPASLQ